MNKNLVSISSLVSLSYESIYSEKGEVRVQNID